MEKRQKVRRQQTLNGAEGIDLLESMVDGILLFLKLATVGILGMCQTVVCPLACMENVLSTFLYAVRLLSLTLEVSSDLRLCYKGR